MVGTEYADHRSPCERVYTSMVDIELITQELRDLGHFVDGITPLPANAGNYEFRVDGKILTLEEARALLASESRK